MTTNQLKAGVFLSYISIGLSYIVALIYTPVMLRLLGQSEYGLYNLVASVVSYLGLLNFGFGSAYMRYYSRFKVYNDQDNIAKLNGMLLIGLSLIGLVAILAGSVLVLNTEFILGEKLTAEELATARILMAILVFNIAVSFPNIVFNSHIAANEQFIFQKLLQLIRTVTSPFIILPVLFMGYGAVGMVLVMTVINIGIEIANAVFCFKKLQMRFTFRQFDFSLMKEMTIFSSYVFLNIVFDQINWNVDKFILGRFHGTVAVAIYGLAAQLNMKYVSLSIAISNVFIPRVNRMVAAAKDNSELTGLFTKVGRVQFIFLSMILTGFIFFGRPFINLWAGANYNDSYLIALILMAPITVDLIQNLAIAILRAKNLHQFRSIIFFLVAIVNIAITIPLAKLYGGVGCAIGTAFAFIIGNGLVMNIYYHKKVGLDMVLFWGQILKFIPALLPPVFVGLLLVTFVDLFKISSFLLSGTLFVLVFIISLWYLGMNPYEKDLIGKPISNLMKKLMLKRR